MWTHSLKMKTILQCFGTKNETIFKQPQVIKEDQNNLKHGSLYICLDTSGSMGDDLQQATQSVESLLNDVYDTFDEVILFDFSESTIVTKLTENYSKTLADVKVRGCTNFIDALSQVTDRLEKTQNDTFVIFLTDGQHNDGGDVVEDILKRKLFMNQYSKNVSFHCIGFTTGHDAKILNSISNLGCTEGTFQYAKDSTVLKECISNVQNVMNVGIQRIKLKIKDMEFLEFKGGICVVPFGVSELKDSISLVMNDFEISEIEIEELTENKFEQLDVFISIQNQKLLEIANLVSSSQNIDKVDLENIDDRLTMILEDKRFKSLEKVEKTLIFDRLSQTKKIVGSIYNNHKKNLKNGLSNEDLATLISSSYDHITKRGIKKRLDKRVMNQMDSFKDSDVRLQKICSKMNFDEIEKKFSKESLEFYKCALSCCNLVECMKDKNSVCLSVKISRNQSAIMDPSQLRINQIGNTIISSNSFLDSVQYKLDSLKSNEQTEIEELHGGFSGKNGSILKGIAREDISGVIPLYIQEDHWKIQKENLIPALGWMTTLDVFGYESQQLRTIPFVTLNSFLSTQKMSDFHAISFFQLIRTCRQIYVENKMRVLDFNIGENRLSDVVSNLNLLLGKLLVDDIHYENLEELILFIVEECLRRNVKNVGDTFTQLIVDNLKCDSIITMRKDLEPHELHDETTQYVENDYDVNQSNDMINIFEDQVKMLIPILSKFYLIYKTFHKYFLGDFCKEIDESSGIPSTTLIKELKDIFSMESPTGIGELLKFMSIEPLSKNQISALIIQCVDTRTNAARKESIQNGTLFDAFKESDKILDAFINNQKRSQINRIKSLCLAAHNLEHKFEKFELNHLMKLIPIKNEYYNEMIETKVFKSQIFKIHTMYTSSVHARSSILDVTIDNCVKELVVLVKGKPIIVVTNGPGNINIHSVAKSLKLSSDDVKFPTSFEASSCLTKHGYSLDSVPMFGFKKVPVYINQRIFSKKSEEMMICASGNSNYLMKIEVGEMMKIPGVKMLEIQTDYTRLY
jgi:prolyl-tRNA editing enzyme YbaK/EbsC (Cys-tRNA(Pro) deacylase)